MAEVKRILLVDDDEDEFVVARDLFRDIGPGYQLDWVRTFEEGQAEIARCAYDAFMVDYHLGPRTGIELLREAKANGCRAPILILTGAGDRAVDLEAQEAGAADFLDKGQLTAALLERSLRYSIERHKAEQKLADTSAQVRALQAAEKQLHQAVRTRDEFLSIASHELKTPLTPLVLQLGQLQRALRTNPELYPLVEIARRQTARLASLIDGLLDGTRLNEGALLLQREEFDLSELAHHVADRFHSHAEASRCPVQIESDSAARGRWDRFRVEQVIANLLSNAFKYGRGKPVELRIWSGDDGVRLSVRDNGIGIAHENVNRIFGRFERAVSSRHYGGLGLGLYVANEIVEAHGGCILVQSEPGSGSTFTVVLPRDQPSEQPEVVQH
jgi:signal transduction histidine kinase